MFQKIKNLLIHFPKSIFYPIFYQQPSKKLTLIGITGTDGKTTTAILVYEILKKAGINAGVITTIGAKYNDREIDTGLHLPALTLQLSKKYSKKWLTLVLLM